MITKVGIIMYTYKKGDRNSCLDNPTPYSLCSYGKNPACTVAIYEMRSTACVYKREKMNPSQMDKC